MVNAFTFDDGSSRSFPTRARMYEWMIENGHVIVEGDDAPMFDAVVAKSRSEKAAATIERVSALRGQ